VSGRPHRLVAGAAGRASCFTAWGGQSRQQLSPNPGPRPRWVTSVAWLPDGRILSGGMDGALWLWAAGGGATGRKLQGHAGPVSQVRA
jgi:WD40 repeat protein